MLILKQKIKNYVLRHGAYFRITKKRFWRIWKKLKFEIKNNKVRETGCAKREYVFAANKFLWNSNAGNGEGVILVLRTWQGDFSCGFLRRTRIKSLGCIDQFWTMPYSDLIVALKNFGKNTQGQKLQGGNEQFGNYRTIIFHCKTQRSQFKDLMVNPQGKPWRKKSYWLNSRNFKANIHMINPVTRTNEARI